MGSASVWSTKPAAMHNFPYPPDTSAMSLRLVYRSTAAATAAGLVQPSDSSSRECRRSTYAVRSPSTVMSVETMAFRCSYRRISANTATGYAVALVATAETIERLMHGLVCALDAVVDCVGRPVVGVVDAMKNLRVARFSLARCAE